MLGFLRRRRPPPGDVVARAPLPPLPAPFPSDPQALPDLSQPLALDAAGARDLSLLPPPAAMAAAPPPEPRPAPPVLLPADLPAWVRDQPAPEAGVDLVFADGSVVRLDPADPRVRTFLAAAEVLLAR